MRRRLVLAAMLATGCVRPGNRLVVMASRLPAPPGARVPQVAPLGNGALLVSWLDPRPDAGYALQFTSGRPGAWGVPRTVVDDSAITMFSADLPGLAEAPDGTLYAYWETKDLRTSDRYATEIRVARSRDGGVTWGAPVIPHTDHLSGQHGFISTFPAGDSLGFVWLDARQQRYVPPDSARHLGPRWTGTIGLATRAFGPHGLPGGDGWVDAVTCECCPTAAAVTTRGPVVVYRDRDRAAALALGDSADGSAVRDISLRRREGDGWTPAIRVHADNWVFNGCPDNGPAVDARGDSVVVAWWTAAGGIPQVRVAFSADAGDRFGPPTRVDLRRAEGQVTVASIPGGAIVGWAERGHTWARRVTTAGRVGAALDLGPAPPHTRLPRWVGTGEGAIAVWTVVASGAGRSILAGSLEIR